MRALGLIALPLLSVACGGQVGSVGSNDHNDPTIDHPHNNLPNGTILGSFDLKFDHVTATSKYAGSPPGVTPPSQGANARIDVASSLNDGDVLIAPQWADPAHFISSVTSSTLRLDGGNAEFQSDDSFYVSDSWKSFTFGRTGNGGFDGTFTASGEEEVTEGDEVFELDLLANGTIGPDQTAPDVKVTGPGGTILPWDPIDVRLSEPIAKPFSAILSLDTSSSHGTVQDDPNATSTTAQLTSWSSVAATLSASSFADPSGNASASRAFPIAFFDPGTPAAQFNFDSATSNAAKWDDASLVTFMNTDASCESGGCAKIGPLTNNGCTVSNSGLAGVLQHDAAYLDIVLVRYRILVGVDNSGGSDNPVTPDSSIFSVETATPGQAPSSQSFGFQLTDLQTIPSTFGMTQATPWTTASINVSPSTQIGFGIRFGSSYYCGGPIFNQNNVIVLIDSITTN